MSITINGSGTLTGISAGGYPDATVTADDLAATLDLSDKTLTMPAGSILQVVQATHATQADSTSTSFADTGLSASITPSSSSNKVLVYANFIIGNGDSRWNYVTLVRGSTNLSPNSSQPQLAGNYTNGSSDFHNTGSIVFLDSPSTTSATTYKLQFRTNSSGNAIRFGTDGIPSVIVLLEVAG